MRAPIGAVIVGLGDEIDAVGAQLPGNDGGRKRIAAAILSGRKTGKARQIEYGTFLIGEADIGLAEERHDGIEAGIGRPVERAIGADHVAAQRHDDVFGLPAAREHGGQYEGGGTQALTEHRRGASFSASGTGGTPGTRLPRRDGKGNADGQPKGDMRQTLTASVAAPIFRPWTKWT